MAQSNEGQKEPHNMPSSPSKSNNSVKTSGSVPNAQEVFEGPKQKYSGVMDPNKKAGDFPRK